MNNGELAVSAETLTRAFAFSLYALSSASCWRLFPRLSLASRRLASVMLVAQIVVIAVAMEIQPSSEFEEWLWDLGKEWNIPSTLASVQLALVGSIALVTAWLARTRPTWQRLYLVGLGLVFLFLAWDEYSILHERILNWKRIYAAGGVVAAVATMAVAVRSPRRMRIWHLYLLVGLAISAAGAIFFELLSPACGSLGFLRLDGCLRLSFWEELLEFLGIWLALAAMLGHFSDVSPAVRIQRFLYALPALYIFLLSQSAAILPIQVSFFAKGAKPVSVEFESLHLHGFHINRRAGFHPFLHFSLRQWDLNGLGFSIHLVDTISGESVASRHEQVDLQHSPWVFGTRAPVYRQQMELEIPPQPPNRVFYIALTVWREKDGEFARQKVLASDLQLLDDTQVILLAEVPAGAIRYPAASTGQ